MRKAIGDEMELMVDANQGFTITEAIRRRAPLRNSIAWFEAAAGRGFEWPCPAAAIRDQPADRRGSRYSISHFREYIRRGAYSIIAGGRRAVKHHATRILPDRSTCRSHYLMELHISLCAAVPNCPWIENIPARRDRE